MKRSTGLLAGVGLVSAALTGLVAARPASSRARQVSRATSARAAVAWDLSPPLSAMEQFIPEKPVVIHPAVVSKAELEGTSKGPGTGLGATAPPPPVVRPGAGGRAPRAG